MDDRIVALVGAATVVTVAGRRIRPLAKAVLRGVLLTQEATSPVRRGLQELYSEVKAERAGPAAQPQSAGAPPAPPSAGAPG